jgi:hypothetical protein
VRLIGAVSFPCGVGGVCCAALDRQRREETSTLGFISSVVSLFTASLP